MLELKLISKWKIGLGLAILAILAVFGVDYITKVEYQPLLDPDQLPSHIARITEGKSEAYVEQVAAGRSDAYAGVYADMHHWALTENPSFIETAPEWVVDDNRPKFASIYAEQYAAGRDRSYATEYAANIVTGESPEYAHAIGEVLDNMGKAEVLGQRGLVAPEYAYYYAESIDTDRDRMQATSHAFEQTMYPAVVLAMYSTANDTEADKRAAAVREMITNVGRGDMDSDMVLSLLRDMAPEASIGEREKALDLLASISDDGDGELTPQQSVQVANELTRLVTGHGVDAEQRTGAAREMVRLLQSGELNADNAAELMNEIAPEWSVKERKEALGYLAWQFSHGDWDTGSTKRTAEEGYTLITGGEIQIEKRLEAGVQLIGEGLKRYGGPGYDDESVDKSTALVQRAISGDLNTDNVSNILGIDSGKSSTRDNNTEQNAASSRHQLIYDRAEGQMYRQKRKIGHSFFWVFPGNSTDDKHAREMARMYASEYARSIVTDGKSPAYARAYARYGRRLRTPERERGWYSKSPEWVRERERWEQRARTYAATYDRLYTRALAEGNSSMYAEAYARAVAEDESLPFAQAFAEMVVASAPTTFASAYVEMIGDHKSPVYAYEYANQVVVGESAEYAHAYAGQIESGKSREYAEAYAFGIAYDFDVDYDTSMLPNWKRLHYSSSWQYGKVNYSPTLLPTYAHAYAEQIEAGKSGIYARYYGEQTEGGKSEEYSHAYAEQIEGGKSEEYAHAYAEQIEGGKSEEYAHAYAYAEQIEALAIEALSNQPGKESAKLSVEQQAGKSARYAQGFVEQQNAGRSAEYAHVYASLIAAGKTDEYAQAYTEQVHAGRPAFYGRIYAWVVDLTN